MGNTKYLELPPFGCESCFKGSISVSKDAIVSLLLCDWYDSLLFQCLSHQAINEEKEDKVVKSMNGFSTKKSVSWPTFDSVFFKELLQPEPTTLYQKYFWTAVDFGMRKTCLNVAEANNAQLRCKAENLWKNITAEEHPGSKQKWPAF